ncbi:MAG: hypothetical protein CO158_08375 [Piscirickettsiaceae bacterium CG_4_9_14_3_um_filter_43_564]|nr:hypothetical protein [Thiomicrospira sp.]OIP93569.1 MAG: hypothetical protein AUK56_11535 [Thiomicrospira sp. CG2_30_44_34]PIQ05178.1 MAG: hypothetical protein COW74_03055 [Piscirickettsiaceae bacterium CG18_big_fil_WC_8_21_14_2_50_44_103]PIU38821.1 MAG: hypothetical protein COT01_04795 [Piscirickettsiaceae bacterium CG07_land_8_20_14_0_80_44_28]PIW57104.1 MAG: hypothetical protein COW14_07630 [Piscirickettsiaceae bacterium CG12_big_fil_rev_8_21_14_0_65_44_934]PIW78458.1 MAG: hypothetical p
MNKHISLAALILSAFVAVTGSVQAETASDIETAKTLTLCVDYFDLTDENQKAVYLKELDRRGQLSVEDHENFAKGQVVNGCTLCGMYMTLGKPLSETSKQIRPMVFKAVHVYPEHYYVTQSGMVVNHFARKPGVMPPKLNESVPETQAPPVIFNAPGGQPKHH